MRECDGESVTLAATPPLDAACCSKLRGCWSARADPCAHINKEEAYPSIHSMETGEETLLPAKYLGHWPGADPDSLFG